MALRQRDSLLREMRPCAGFRGRRRSLAAWWPRRRNLSIPDDDRSHCRLPGTMPGRSASEAVGRGAPSEEDSRPARDFLPAWESSTEAACPGRQKLAPRERSLPSPLRRWEATLWRDRRRAGRYRSPDAAVAGKPARRANGNRAPARFPVVAQEPHVDRRRGARRCSWAAIVFFVQTKDGTISGGRDR